MGQGLGLGRPPQNGYDIVPAPPGTTRVPSTSVRSGRRTDSVTTNRIATGDALVGEVLLLCIRPHREASVPLQVEALGLGTDRGRCIVFRQRQMFVILTLRCRCRKLPPRGTPPRKARVADGNKTPAQKSRLVPNL